MNLNQTKTRILEAITELSPEALAELQLFFDFLQFKYGKNMLKLNLLPT